MRDDRLRFRLDGFHNRTLGAWRGGNRSPQANARRHAMKHGVAGAWRADDSFTLFYRDGGRIRQRTWKRAIPMHLAPEARQQA